MAVQLSQINTNNKEADGRISRLKKLPTPSELLFKKTLKRICKKYKAPFVDQFYIKPGKKKYYILDFYVPYLKIAFEIDGGIHNRQENYDTQRDIDIMSLGIVIQRIKNEDVVEPEIGRIIDRVFKERLKQAYESKKFALKKLRHEVVFDIIEASIREGTTQERFSNINNILKKHIKKMIGLSYGISQCGNILNKRTIKTYQNKI